MKKRKNIAAKIMAFLALFGIIISIIGTGLMIILNNNSSQTELSPEQLQQLQELINSQSGVTVNTSTGTTNSGTITSSGTIEN